MKLFAHQQKFLDQNPDKHALIWGTGSGKSLTALEWALLKRCPVLIICPKGLKTQWQNTLVSWDKIDAPSILILTKEEFKRQVKHLPSYPAVIVDEAHYFFGMKSALSKALHAYFKTHNTPHRLFLTATPYRSSPWDVYRLMELLGHKSIPSWFMFQNQFFYKVSMGGRMIPMPKKNMDRELTDYIRLVGSVVRLEDCIDVPPQIFDVEYFSLTKTQSKAIKEAYDPLPIVRFTKIHQICGGTLKGDEYSPSQVFESDKMDRLLDIVDTHDKMIVVCRYNNEIDILSDRLRQKGTHLVKSINGDVPGEERQAILELLRMSPKYVLLVNAACSEGWELSDCPLMVFYSYSFSLLNYVQMLGRIQRINNIKKNTYLSLIVKGTIDEDIYKTIVDKKMDFHLSIYSQN